TAITLNSTPMITDSAILATPTFTDSCSRPAPLYWAIKIPVPLLTNVETMIKKKVICVITPTADTALSE
ncbi:hypothetical protein D049_0089B, partial [Vibrio parahaemolyticus VPTS-2010]